MITQRPIDFVFDVLSKTRGSESLRMDDVVACSALLYCRQRDISYSITKLNQYHSYFSIDINHRFSDSTIIALNNVLKENRLSDIVVEFDHALRSLDDNYLRDYYSELVDSFFRVIANIFGKRGSVDYIQPSSVTKLITYFLRRENVASIYNPFAGLCSYPIALGKDGSFFAQEVNSLTLALAKIRLHAYGLNPDNVVCEDSILNWDDKGAEAIVASVPFGLLIEPSLRRRHHISSSVVEDYFFFRSMGLGDDGACGSSHKKLVATIVPQSFSFRSNSLSIREEMCARGCLDTIIELPEGIFPNTSIATSIVILSFMKKKEQVRFVNAREALLEQSPKLRRLDWEKVVSYLENDDPDYVKYVSYEDLQSQEYILNGDNYMPASFIPEKGNQVIRLVDLLARVPESRIEHPVPVKCLPEEFFSNKVLDIEHPRTDALKVQEISSGISVTGPCILFMLKDRQVVAYVHSTQTTISIPRRAFAFKVVSDEVSPEYLTAKLVNDDIFRRQLMTIPVLRNSGAARFLLNRNIVIPDSQGQDLYLKFYETKESTELSQLRAAEDARYQINKAGSDIAHMLGSVFKKQNELISEIPFLKPGTEKYQSYVTSLIDTAQYINRVITAVGKDLAKAKINLKKISISEVIADYVRAWGNYSGLEDFTLITQDLTQGDVILKMDILFLRIMLDTLIDNAWRHGFDKGIFQAEEGNKIAIRLAPVILDRKRYIVLSVMNNGHPLSDGYTVKDYIERGNYRGNAGRTGLGGHHVYTIAQRHEGHISLNSEHDWSFVVDVLLPIESPGSTVFNTEYDGEYV